MKISVSSLKPRPILLGATESPGELGLAAEGVEFHAPVEVSVKVTRMQQDVLAQGRAHTTARVQCSRCLADVELELTGEFEALFVPESGSYGKRLGRPDFEWGDQRVSFYSELTVDLTSEIAQSVLVELPMRRLCRSDCAGLCSQCGQNLNDGPCDCKPEDDDPFASLRELFPPAADGDS